MKGDKIWLLATVTTSPSIQWRTCYSNCTIWTAWTTDSTSCVNGFGADVCGPYPNANGVASWPPNTYQAQVQINGSVSNIVDITVN